MYKIIFFHNFDLFINSLRALLNILPLGFLGILFTNRTPPLKRFCVDTCPNKHYMSVNIFVKLFNYYKITKQIK